MGKKTNLSLSTGPEKTIIDKLFIQRINNRRSK